MLIGRPQFGVQVQIGSQEIRAEEGPFGLILDLRNGKSSGQGLGVAEQVPVFPACLAAKAFVGII